jgi:hypothetical protein
MAKEAAVTPAKQEDPEYSFRDLERQYKKNQKATEALGDIPQSPEIKASIKALENMNELIKKRAYKIVDEKFGKM